MKQHIEDFLKFLESRDNRKAPLEAKLLYPNKFNPPTKEELNVKGYLDLSHTEIESLPDNLTVDGSLWLTGSKIKSLPDNLKIGGTLDLSDSTIESLPDNFTVGCDLDISYTVIDAFPNNLKVGGNLHIWETPLASKMTKEEIRQKIENKGGYVKGNINR